MPKPGPRTTYKYTEEFKATAGSSMLASVTIPIKCVDMCY
jgi:hypothetical protein